MLYRFERGRRLTSTLCGQGASQYTANEPARIDKTWHILHLNCIWIGRIVAIHPVHDCPMVYRVTTVWWLYDGIIVCLTHSIKPDPVLIDDRHNKNTVESASYKVYTAPQNLHLYNASATLFVCYSFTVHIYIILSIINFLFNIIVSYIFENNNIIVRSTRLLNHI